MVDIPSEQEHIFDSLTLQQVVRLDQCDPSFEILSAVSTPLSAKGFISPDGLLLVRGEGRGKGGTCSWAVVRKRVEFFESDVPGAAEEPRRELRLAQAGLFDQLPGPLAAPRIYHIAESPTGGEIWMEFIQDASPEHWRLDDFQFAAYEIARFNAACLNSPALDSFQTHLAHDWLRNWCDGFTTFPEEEVWGNPYVKKFIPGELRVRYEQLITDKERFYRAIESLPQLFLHGDLQRRNLLIRSQAGQRQLVALDWAVCMMGPLGADLSFLIGMSSALYELDPADLPHFAPNIYNAYMDGLQAAGWQGDPAQVRLGTTAWMALQHNIFPKIIAIFTSEDGIQAGLKQFGCGPDEYVSGWVSNFRYFLDLADEARNLMG